MPRPAVPNTSAVFTTAVGNKTTAAFTPVLKELYVVFAGCTGSITDAVISDTNADGLGTSGTYVKATAAITNSSADGYTCWVRGSFVGSATSNTVTATLPTNTGGGLFVFRVTDAANAGAAAIRQVAFQNNSPATGTPAPSFANPTIVTNLVLSMVFNATNPGGVGNPTGYGLGAGGGYATPTTGASSCFSQTGGGSASRTTLTWGTTSPSAFCSMAVEIIGHTPRGITSFPDAGANMMRNLRRRGSILVPKLWLPQPHPLAV